MNTFKNIQKREFLVSPPKGTRGRTSGEIMRDLRLSVLLAASILSALGCKGTPTPSQERAATPPKATAAPHATETAKLAARDEPAQGLAAPAGQDRAAANPSKATEICETLCRLSAPLGCKNARECRPRCQSMAESPVCSPELGALFKCLIRQPTKNWECDEDGIGAIRVPYCDKEQGNVAACLESKQVR